MINVYHQTFGAKLDKGSNCILTLAHFGIFGDKLSDDGN